MPYRRRESSRPRKMHKTVCVSRGSGCDVPFKSDPNISVFCREVLAKEKVVEKVLAMAFNQSFLLIP